MGKVSTEKIRMEDLIFSYDVNVDKEGIFSTTLPAPIVTMFEEAMIDLNRNRLRNYGYFADSTYEGLKKQVTEVCQEYFSKELISEKIVIKYVIQTTCAYCLNKNGEIVPNAASEWTGKDDRESNDWKQGTENQHAQEPRPFGMQVYVRPSTRRGYRYKSGKIKVTYDDYSPFGNREAADDRPWLYWLESVCSICPPYRTTPQEIDYTEERAKFFVDILRGLCKINEQIKDCLTPDAISLLVERKQKLLQ